MNDTFPYRNKIYSDKQKIAMFNILKKYNLEFKKHQQMLTTINVKIPYPLF